MKWPRWGLVCLGLIGCAPAATRGVSQFAATTSVVGRRIQVAVINRGPSAVWLDRNVCPQPFPVEIGGTFRLLPWTDGVRETCLAIFKSPVLWNVGETKTTIWPNASLASGTAELRAVARLKIAPGDRGEIAGAFTALRITAPLVVVDVP